jgi:hypothetical protein
VDFA